MHEEWCMPTSSPVLKGTSRASWMLFLIVRGQKLLHFVELLHSPGWMQLVCLTSVINMLAAICVCHLFLVLPRLAQTRANTANFQVYRGPQLEARAEKANRARGLDLKAGHRTPAINCTIRLCHVVRLFLFLFLS